MAQRKRSLLPALIALQLPLALLCAGAAELDAPGVPTGIDVPSLSVSPSAAVPIPGMPEFSGAPAVPGAAELPLQPQAEASPEAAAVEPAVELAGIQPAIAPALVAPVAAQPFMSPAAAQAAAVANRYSSLIESLAPVHLTQISGEEAKDLSNRFIDPSDAQPGSSEDVSAGPGSQAPSSSGLAPANDSRRSTRGDNVPQLPGDAPTSLRQKIADRIHFADHWVANLWFYIVDNIRMKWPPYYAAWKQQVASGRRPAISRPRDFFAHMRVMGQTGAFEVLGFIPRLDGPVVTEAQETFQKYFDAPGIGPVERAAFDRFLDRARLYNAERRAPSNFRKLVRDNMLKASTLPVSQIAPFFDGLYQDAAKTTDFQTGGAADVLKRFQEIVDDELRAEPAGAKGQVLGVILIGSFASGAATPTSDFDAEFVTRGGSRERTTAFMERVLARWKAEGRQKTNPVTFHEGPLSFSRWVIRRVHDCPYLVISPDPAVVATLAMRPGEPPAFQPGRELTATGKALRGLQYAGVYVSTFLPAKK